MNIYYAVAVFIFGTVIGSFLNVCIYRIPKGESVVYPSSHCTNCSTEIKWFDLVPIVSYIVLRGKCRYCGEKISAGYPIIEFATAFLYLMLYVKFGLSIEFARYAVFTGILIVVSVIDFNTTDVYFSTIVTGIVFALAFILLYWHMGLEIKSFIYGGILSGLFFTIIIFVTRGGMGWGDMEICLFCGLFLGLKLSFAAIFLSFMLGSIVGLILILSGKKSKKDYIPFGPFISISSIIAIFLGRNIVNLYVI
ncbi:MAG TPA: prepilin peptidase [Clostridium sp.]|uniref:A24 family peptidase n=1 Tax=Clostridium lapidicellarium TaxID=3240931 RepID=A0ABV4DWK7_9CLOT|nr:A24 family peptidase [uncultured Clostridium sp.]NLU08172.1 prepilin peptidase [Clostridiales bacterium]HBC96631.1 prepilin peptidase [Clostridium sp.]